jgi:GNAT superfamily N-acetyltransferase
MVTIRQAEIDDLPTLEPLGRQFYEQSKFLRHLDWGRFCALWAGLLAADTGVIFQLFDGAGQLSGLLGGVAYPEPYSGNLIATEFFWFVQESSRGKGLSLYKAFEQWARQRGCSEIRMVHLVDLMPEKLERVYRHLGFEPAEVHYVKELKP